MIRFVSTRGDTTPKSFTDVLLAGMAPDGGLYVPTKWPHVDVESLAGLSYIEIAFKIVKQFTGDDIPDDDLQNIIWDTYDGFKHPAIAPLVQVGRNSWILELFHGPTLAFKDYPLQLLGRLFDYVLEKKGQRVTIVGATSGDTGSAAIDAFKNSPHADIFILHPQGRTSEVQRRQMTSVDDFNVFNIAVEGHFDDCQNAVKAMFADTEFRDSLNLSAVNSINWARVMAQIVYYFVAAAALGVDAKRKISFAVPTGNFGNVYAAYCAKQMGLPIDRLIIGTNRNDILTRFFETGSMTAGNVEPSLSPSMDIQVSSNFERFLFDVLDRDGAEVCAKMQHFKTHGEFSLNDNHIKKARGIFDAVRCSDLQTAVMMDQCYRETGYLLDPHTAVGLHAGFETERNYAVPLVALACAHPAKFPDAVEKATGIRPPLPPHMADLYDREEIFTVLPNDLETLKTFVRTNVNASS